MENVGSSESIRQYDAEAPLVGGIRLDPERIKTKHNGKLITVGNSGESIQIEVASNRISVELVSEPDIHFEAKLEKDEEGKTFIEFFVRTKEVVTEKRASDFYAEKLADAAIEYFSKENDIYGIKFRWYDYSDEYKKYFELKKKILEELSKTQTNSEEAESKAKKRAAFGTWTGEKVALTHGFNEVYIEETKEIEMLPDSEPLPLVTGCFVKKSS